MEIQLTSPTGRSFKPELDWDELKVAIIEIAQATTKAKKAFGLSNRDIGETSELELAKDIADAIWSVRKGAKLLDVVEAIRLFGIGEIRFENQMSVISVANILRAFKYFRDVYIPEKVSQNKIIHIPVERQLTEGGDHRNRIAKRELFLKFVANPNDPILELMQDKFYSELIEIGALQTTDQEKIESYWKMVSDFLDGPEIKYPNTFLTDATKRKDLYTFKTVYDDGKERGMKPNLEVFKNNHFHLCVVKLCKTELIKRALTIGPEALKEMFNNWYFSKDE